MRVHSILGCGFLESVYENALAIELGLKGIFFERQVQLPVQFRQRLIGKYYVDFVVESELLLELKALKSLDNICEAQLLNYLKASRLSVGLLINFGSTSLQLKRMTTRHVKANEQNHPKSIRS